MGLPQGKTRYLLVLLLLLAVGVLFQYGRRHITINSDITAALPQDDPVVASARMIIRHHPALENVFIELSQEGGASGREALADAADVVVARLSQSGLVKVVSEETVSEFMPRLFGLVVDHLPLYFKAEELRTQVGPLLEKERIKADLAEEYRQMYELGRIGQARYLAGDPLGLRNLVLARLGQALPFGDAVLHRGHIFTRDWRHLLIVAEPSAPASDTSFGTRLKALLVELEAETAGRAGPGGGALKMSYAGAFRAALDNEEIIKRDTSRTMVLVSIGLMVVVSLCFRRRRVGLLAIVPAVAGALLATFVYSLFRDVIFAVALGFGGALISITVDHGLAYVLALDRPHETRGREVSREVWAVTSFTVYTTVAALVSLAFSGIPLFLEVGLFAALGVGLSAVFVHLFFPLLFPRLSGATREPTLPMDIFLLRLTSFSNWKTVGGLCALGLFLAFFVRLDFNADLAAMNTMRPETLAAEQEINGHWGNLANRTYIMARADSLDGLWRKSETLTDFLSREKNNGVLGQAFPRLAVLPGPEGQANNLKAWQAFWTPERREYLTRNLAQAAGELGFTADAFTPFLETLADPGEAGLEIPPALYGPLGLSSEREGGGWLLLETVAPGPDYDAESFFQRAATSDFNVFDAQYFSGHLALTLNHSFVRMLVIIGAAALVLLFFLFADWALVLLAVSPLVFSLTATLGTMGLLGLPLAIPSLMLAPVVVGLGMDYGLYLVRARQRYGRSDHPGLAPFRAAVLLGGVSTLMGTGAMALSQHQVLKMAGLSTFMGIGYAMLGTFILVPPILTYLFRPGKPPDHQVAAGSAEHYRLARKRYLHLEPTPRFYARFKMQLDPMFPRLADFVRPGVRIIDLGCGYGIPAAWLQVLYPDIEFFSLEPDAERARVAARALGEGSQVKVAGAMDLLDMEVGKAGAALMLDMIHYLPDSDLAAVLARLWELLEPGGRLIIRATVPGGSKQVWQRRLETWRMARAGLKPCYRTETELSGFLARAGFSRELVEPTAPGREETWFVGLKQ
jgi:predicted exporter/SAM-dependent methyltransferase